MANTIFNPLTGNFDLVVDDAAEIVYSPSISGDWVSAPDDAAEALNSLAANKAGPVSDVGTTSGGQSLVNLSSTTDVRIKGLKAGTGITITNDAGSNNLEISSVAAGGVAIKDEGTPIVPFVTNIDFVGEGVITTTDGVGGAVVTISGGAISISQVTSSPYGIILPGDIYLVDASLSNIQIELPSISIAAKIITIKKIDSSLNTVIISAGGILIDGESSVTIYDQYAFLRFVSNGSIWSLV